MINPIPLERDFDRWRTMSKSEYWSQQSGDVQNVLEEALDRILELEAALQAERELGDVAVTLLRLYVSPDDQGPGGNLLERHRQARVQGESNG